MSNVPEGRGVQRPVKEDPFEVNKRLPSGLGAVVQ
jgi:hypothetical protein